MSKTSHEVFAAVHSTLSDPNKIDTNLYGIDSATRTMGELGVGLVFVARKGYDLGSAEAPMVVAQHTEHGSEGIKLTGDTSVLAVGSEVGAVRAYSSVALPEWLDDAAPVVNGRSLRDLGKDKFRQAEMFFGDIAPTILVTKDESCVDPEALGVILGEKVVVKPNRGASSSSMAIVDNKPQTVNDAIAALRAESAQGDGVAYKAFVIQEYDPAAAIGGAETLFSEANTLIAEAGTQASPEIRVYCFADVVNGELSVRPYVMYRLFAGTEKNLLFPMDPQAAPPTAVSKATQVAAKVLQATGRKGGLIVSDLYVSSVTGEVRIREVNLSNPVTGPKIAMERLPSSLRTLVTEHASKGHGVRLGEQLATLALGRKVTVS